MYLGELVLNGFKSFYSRTSLQFKPGITAIVGPNGCGKSNILDAVRWVLGEQSPTQLRGDEIADVISDGNTRRNPKRTARAELTFRDVREKLELDREELSVAREVGRDGKGRYFLNGDKARLKDIQDMFRDTGVGQDLYSLIGQGDIRDLVVSNPEERREIVEEAAGIASYRHRRDRSKRRLASTREDFEVVDQQLQEKQGRLNQLKGQAEKARTFRSVQEEFRALEFEESRRTYLDLAEEHEAKQDEVEERVQKSEEAQKALDRAEDRRQSLQARNRRLQKGLARLDRFSDREDEKRDEAGQQRIRLETTLESLSDRLDRERTSLEELRNDHREDLSEYADIALETHRTEVKRRVAAREGRLLEQRERTLQESLRDLNRELDSSRGRDRLEADDIQQAKHRSRRLEEELEEATNRLHRMEGEMDRLRTHIGEQRGDLQTVSKRMLDVVRRREEMRRQHRVHSRRTDMLENLAPRLNQREERLRERIENQREKRNTLKKLHGEYRGFYDGVQAIMQRVDQGTFEGVFGVVANLIDVPGSLEEALQVALGGRLQNIVVERQRDVSPMVDYLKEQDAGRATFLPLDSLQPGRVPDSARSLTERQGVVGFARNLIDYPEEIERAVDYLLGRVIVVEELEEGLRLQREGHLEGWGGMVVSLDGEKVHSGGPVTGGTVNPRSGQLLSRSGKLDELAAEIEELEEELEATRATRKRLEDDLREANDRLDRMINALRGMEDETRRLRQSLRDQEQNLAMKQQGFRSTHTDVVEALRRRRTVRFRTLSYRELARLVRNREERRKERTRDVRRRRTQLDEKRETVGEWRRKAERREDRARSRAEDLSERKQRVIERCRRRETQRRQRLDQIDQITLRRRNLRGEYVQTSLTHGRRERIRDAWRSLEADLRSRQEDFQEKLDRANRRLQEAEREAEKERNRLRTARNQAEDIENRLQEQARHLEDEFGVEADPDRLSERDPGEDVPGDREELREQLREKRSSLKEMRPVNMLADKQARELEEEVEDLRSQREDLETACNQLERLIDRLNRRAREQFREAFEEIQGHFERYVGDLFQGGEGHLRLSDDPVLEAGVHLEVQPPGERLQQMSALSGGEKSMAAIAFLFALFERKTTPFCFLDEVDAALDDQNLAQFVQLLHRFEEETQFIIITHKKITMQSAAQLYGVTMAESGVSEIVGIEMDEAEQFRTTGET